MGQHAEETLTLTRCVRSAPKVQAILWRIVFAHAVFSEILNDRQPLDLVVPWIPLQAMGTSVPLRSAVNVGIMEMAY
jgi:hypothetical protein